MDRLFYILFRKAFSALIFKFLSLCFIELFQAEYCEVLIKVRKTIFWLLFKEQMKGNKSRGKGPNLRILY